MKRRKSGFTLVELIIVIAVIGVLAAILIPVFSNVISKASEKSARSDARNSVSQYVVDAMESMSDNNEPSLPKDIVMMVFKSGKCYLYGYDMTTSGELQCSLLNDDPMKTDSPVEMINTHSYNSLVGDTPVPTSGSYNINSDGAFYLYVHEELRSLRGATFSTIPGTGYMSIETSESMGDGILLFHGFLLPGTFKLENGTNGNGSSRPETPTESTAPVDPVTHTVSVAINGIESSADKAKVVFKNSGTPFTGTTTVNDGTSLNLFLATLSAEYPHNADTDDYWYVLETMTASPNNDKIVSDITVTFNFTKVSMYKLEFVMGTGETFVPANGASATMRLAAGTNVTDYIRKSSATTTAAGKTFSHWQKQGDESVIYEPTGAAITLTGNLKLVPVFGTKTVKVTYKAGTNGTGADVVKTVNYGSNTLMTFAETGFTANTGYAFYRWTINGTEYAEGTSYNFTADTTVTAKYNKLYSVSYNANGGTGSMAGQSNIVGGTTINLPNCTFTAPTGKHFTGWKANNAGSIITAGTAYQVNDDVTFYAQWENEPSGDTFECTFNITYYLNGSRVLPADRTDFNTATYTQYCVPGNNTIYRADLIADGKWPTPSIAGGYFAGLEKAGIRSDEWTVSVVSGTTVYDIIIPVAEVTGNDPLLPGDDVECTINLNFKMIITGTPIETKVWTHKLNVGNNIVTRSQMIYDNVWAKPSSSNADYEYFAFEKNETSFNSDTQITEWEIAFDGTNTNLSLDIYVVGMDASTMVKGNALHADPMYIGSKNQPVVA